MALQVGASAWWLLATGLLLWFITKSSYLKSYFRSAWLVLRLPGPTAWPIIGNAYMAANTAQLVKAAIECPQKYGLIFRAWISFYPTVFLADPNHIQKIFSSSKHIEKLNFYKMLHNFLGTGLITSEGKVWRVHRKLMQPRFSLSILEEFVQVFSNGGSKLVSRMSKEIENGSHNVNVTSLINKSVFNILTEAVLGVPMDSELAATYASESPYRQGTTTLMHRLIRPWLLLPGFFNFTELAIKELQQKKDLYEFTRKTLERRKLEFSGEESTEKCFLDHLLGINAENPESFTESDCIHEACTLMLAGQDSVGAALAFTLHLLANHSDVQEKVAAEQYEIFEGSDRLLALNDLKKMTYLEQCIKEALRLYPSVPIIGRSLGEDVRLGKWLLPKGCSVFVSPYMTHRLSDIYPDPERFNPDRFDPQESAKRSPYAFIPFSAGPRNCIGYKFAELEMKSVVSTMLRNFELKPVPGKETPKISYRITLRASGGLWVNLQPRKWPITVP